MASPTELIAAIHDERLCSIDDPAAVAACGAIGERTQRDVDAAIESLAAGGIEVERPVVGPTQRHTADLEVPDAATAFRCAERLAEAGFDVWEPTRRGAGAAHARFRNVITLARTTDVTVAFRVRWPASASRVPAALRPNQADFGFVDLPSALWPLYLLVRPLRLFGERVGVLTPAPPVLGPFLSTPNDVIGPLLQLAEVTADDTVADLGCGDGRILVEAVTRTGCRAIGVESDPDLVAAARSRAEAAGVTDRLRLVEGDALATDISDATVVFVFLPAGSAASLVDRLRSTLSPGTRIIAHEQTRLPELAGEVESVPLIAGQGVTVAHRWIAGR